MTGISRLRFRWFELLHHISANEQIHLMLLDNPHADYTNTNIHKPHAESHKRFGSRHGVQGRTIEELGIQMLVFVLVKYLNWGLLTLIMTEALLS